MKKKVGRGKKSKEAGALCLVLLGVLIGIFIASLNDSSADGICSPKIGCVGDTLVYQTVSCGLLVNTGGENAACLNGVLVENHPLVSTSIGTGSSAVIIETEMLGLVDSGTTWEYYSRDEIPSDYFGVDDLFLAPNEQLVCMR